MERVKNEKERICGILHDLVEDTNWTFEDLEKESLENKKSSAIHMRNRSVRRNCLVTYLW